MGVSERPWILPRETGRGWECLKRGCQAYTVENEDRPVRQLHIPSAVCRNLPASVSPLQNWFRIGHEVPTACTDGKGRDWDGYHWHRKCLAIPIGLRVHRGSTRLRLGSLDAHPWWDLIGWLQARKNFVNSFSPQRCLWERIMWDGETINLNDASFMKRMYSRSWKGHTFISLVLPPFCFKVVGYSGLPGWAVELTLFLLNNLS